MAYDDAGVWIPTDAAPTDPAITTGGQPSHATNRLLQIIKGLGVEEDHIIEIDPMRKFHEENTALISKELAYNGVSVILAQRECIQTAIKRKKSEKK